MDSDKWNEPASVACFQGFNHLTAQLVTATAALLTFEGTPEEAQGPFQEKLQQLTDETNAAWERIKGNRPNGSPVTKGTVKLVFENVLRICLAELEKA